MSQTTVRERLGFEPKPDADPINEILLSEAMAEGRSEWASWLFEEEEYRPIREILLIGAKAEGWIEPSEKRVC